MKRIFADTAYWIAIFNKRDELHQKAMSVQDEQMPFIVLTSEMVLPEFLNHVSGSGSNLRRKAALLVENLGKITNIEVARQTSIQFQEAVKRFKSRPDKSWSLTDCSSFLLMEENHLRDALTYDIHFIQAGFRALLRDES